MSDRYMSRENSQLLRVENTAYSRITVISYIEAEKPCDGELMEENEKDEVFLPII